MSVGPVCSFLLEKLTNSEAGPTGNTGWKGRPQGGDLKRQMHRAHGGWRGPHPMGQPGHRLPSCGQPRALTGGWQRLCRWSSVGRSSHTENSREGDHPRPSFTCSWCLEYVGHPRGDSRLGGTTFVCTACPRLMTPGHVLSSRISEQPETARVSATHRQILEKLSRKMRRSKVLGGKRRGEEGPNRRQIYINTDIKIMVINPN